MVRILKDFRKVSVNSLARFLHRSDYSRWSNSQNLEEWWESRTIKIARMIPRNTRIIEFGAGRRWLEKHIDPDCSYIPSDLVDRGPGTIICDLNRRPLPDLGDLNPEVAVFSGVLEYIGDLPSLIVWLGGQVSYCVASYAYRRRASRLGRVKEKWSRTRLGYMNHYTEEEFLAVFEGGAFRCISKDMWQDQRLFLFENLRPTED